MIVVVITMILAVPVAFMQVPAVLVVVVVRMAPIRTSVRRVIPASTHPDVTALVDTPISVNPRVSLTRGWRTALIAHRWRWLAADDNADLRGRRSRKSGGRDGGHGQGADK